MRVVRSDRTMRHSARVMLIATAILATNNAASAGNDSVGMTITSDRDPDNFEVAVALFPIIA